MTKALTRVIKCFSFKTHMIDHKFTKPLCVLVLLSKMDDNWKNFLVMHTQRQTVPCSEIVGEIEREKERELYSLRERCQGNPTPTDISISLS